MPESLEISVIVVNYNSGKLLAACLESLETHVKRRFEAVVVDNDSRDGSEGATARFPFARLISAGTNLGFAKGCNLGARHAHGRVFHFLNPDARVSESIQTAYAAALGENRAIFTTRLLDTRRSTERSSHPIPTLGNIVNMLFAPASVARWYLGASVIVPRPVFESLGGWSEDYFLYAEDLDFFYKAWRAGVRVVETPAVVIHDQGGVTRAVWSDRERAARVERSAFVFVRKYGLWLDYFLFRHLAFVKGLMSRPRRSLFELGLFWRELVRSLWAN